MNLQQLEKQELYFGVGKLEQKVQNIIVLKDREQEL